MADDPTGHGCSHGSDQDGTAEPMFVGVVHRISDSEKFFAAAQETLASLPAGIEAQRVLPSADGSNCFCVWKASSIEEVRDIVDGATGGIAVNEYFQISESQAIGLQ